jgi:hypothetical protein
LVLVEDHCKPLEVLLDDLQKYLELRVLLVLQVLVALGEVRTLDVHLDMLHEVLRDEDLLVVCLLTDDRTRIEC